MGGERREGTPDEGRERERFCRREDRPRRRVYEGCVVKGVRSVWGGSERGSVGEGLVRCVAMEENLIEKRRISELLVALGSEQCGWAVLKRRNGRARTTYLGEVCEQIR